MAGVTNIDALLNETDDAEEPVDSQTVILKPYDDICRLFKRKTSGVVLAENQFKPGDIYTYTFDNANIFKKFTQTRDYREKC